MARVESALRRSAGLVVIGGLRRTWSGKATACAALALIALPVVLSCRQIAGIHVVESQPQAECASCVDDSCATAVSACLATASCASRLQCELACDPADPTCEPSCEVQPVGDVDDLGAAQACLAGSCASTCGVSCGGILPAIPPSSAAACSTCIAARCCTPAQACAVSADCSRATECTRSQSVPDALRSCQTVRYPAGVALYSAFATCVEGSCHEACAIGSDWSCVGKVSWPKATSESITGRLTVVNAAAQSQPVPGLSLVPCSSTDVDCKSPLSPPVTTDANGEAVLTFPTRSQSGLTGFVGFLQVTDPSGIYLPALAFSGFPVTQTGIASTMVVGTPAFAMAIAAINGATYDPTRAVIVVSVADCAGSYGANATFSVEPNDPATRVLYTRNALPDRSATATDSGGSAIIGNALVAPTTITTRVAGVTPIVATTPVFTRAGTVTLVLVTPTP